MVIKSGSWSPAEKVGCMDDLTTEIFVRLPVRSLLRFKSVSKHWYSLISSPSFKLPNRDPPSGLFLWSGANKAYIEYDFIPFDIDDPVKPPFITLDFDSDPLQILHSCNGLMLCSSAKYYYVYNPTINQFTTLPKLETNDNNIYISYLYHMSLAFDPSKSPHYKVIYITYETFPSNYKIQIYSSLTRTFDHSLTFTPDEEIQMYFGPSVYWNNTIHWIHRKGFILYLNLDQEIKIVHQIQTPLGCPIGGWVEENNYSNYLFESRDHLLVIEILRPHTSKFTIHELKSDYSGWSMRYNIDLDGICGSFSEIMNPESGVTFEFAILALVLGEKENDSFLILEIPGKALRFNLVSKTFHKLHDFTSPRPKSYSSNFHEVFCRWPYVFEFVESLCSL